LNKQNEQIRVLCKFQLLFVYNRWLHLSSDSWQTNDTVFDYVLLILTTQ